MQHLQRLQQQRQQQQAFLSFPSLPFLPHTLPDLHSVTDSVPLLSLPCWLPHLASSKMQHRVRDQSRCELRAGGACAPNGRSCMLHDTLPADTQIALLLMPHRKERNNEEEE